ncbi:tetratricopeptide repeat protein [Candidatus Poribacteria bacterium]|nr:tetratricopeptide repeat protein [Candidatus Poribacteria bacterium]MYB64956.1 tetratricopeptide repeat protein [Candidatus Poribacteria bacterium]
MYHRISLCLCSILLFMCLVGWIGSWKQSIRTGNDAYWKQEYDAAVNAYQTAVSEKPENPITYHNLGTAYYKIGNFRKASTAFQTSLLKGDTHNPADIYYNLGNAQFQLRDYTAAIMSYEDALDLNPHDSDAKHNLALARQLLKQQLNMTQQQQKESGEKTEEAENDPTNLSKAETEQLLELLTKNENQRRQKILKQKLDSGYRRDKDW